MLRSSKQSPVASARGLRFGIVAARYNAEFTDGLLVAARYTLLKAGAREGNIHCTRVPGSFEIPVVIAKLAASKKFNALIALGVIIRGQTAHADLIANAITQQLLEIAVRNAVPIIHEVLLVDNERQARARCLDTKLNRGAEAARSAIEMARVMEALKS